jgi:hypothetical protein
MKKRSKKNADATAAAEAAAAPEPAAPEPDDADDSTDDKTQPNVETPAFEEGPDTEVGGGALPEGADTRGAEAASPPQPIVGGSEPFQGSEGKSAHGRRVASTVTGRVVGFTFLLRA